MARRWILVVVLLALTAGLGVAVTRGGAPLLDGDLSEGLRAGARGPTATALEAVSWAFSAVGRFVTLGVAVLVVGRLRGPRRALFVAFAWIVAVGLVAAAKDTFPRARPDGGPRAYPSGHVGQAAALAGAVALALSRPRRRLVASVLAAAAILAMAWSRVGLGRHWPTDTLGGAMLGTAAWLAVRAAATRPAGVSGP